CTIPVQRFQIVQLFQNLIGNSLKYSSPDRPPHIHVSSASHSGSKNPLMDSDTIYCRISVQDNGIGFDPAYAEKIFEVFQRLHGKTEYSGTGIGLAIVRKIVENHNGFISVKGEVDKGAEFLVFLPVK
ncbi:MAG: histidine kinase, partial [Chitinophagaceae bacterium]